MYKLTIHPNISFEFVTRDTITYAALHCAEAGCIRVWNKWNEWIHSDCIDVFSYLTARQRVSENRARYLRLGGLLEWYLSAFSIHLEVRIGFEGNRL